MSTKKSSNKKVKVFEAIKLLAGYEQKITGRGTASAAVRRYVVEARTSLHLTFIHRTEEYEIWGVDSFDYDPKRDVTWFFFSDDTYMEGCASFHGSMVVTECFVSSLGTSHNNSHVTKLFQGNKE